MPRPIEFTLTPAAHDADGIADGNDSSGTSVDIDGVLTSGGVFTSSDGLGRIIAIKDSSTNAQNDVDFTVTGFDANGNALSETITGPASGATVVTTQHFAIVTAVTVSAAQGGTETVDIGTVNTTLSASSKAIGLERRADNNPPSCQVTVSGTIDYTIQDSLSERQQVVENMTFNSISAFTGKTAAVVSTFTTHSNVFRVLINSYTAGATLTVRVVEGGC